MKPQSKKMQSTWRDLHHQNNKSNFFQNQNIKKTNERNKPDADLANVAYELSSNGRNTNLTTKLPGYENLAFITYYINQIIFIKEAKYSNHSHFGLYKHSTRPIISDPATYLTCQQVHIQPGCMGYPTIQEQIFPLLEG